MNKAANYLKTLMPILSALYGVAIIYITALPIDGDNPTFVDELLTWLITLAGIALTLFLVHRVEPKLFPAAGQFPLKLPKAIIFVGHYVAGLLYTDGIGDLHNRRAARRPFVKCSCCVARAFTRRVVFQANGYFSISPPWHTDSCLFCDGHTVWTAPRA